MIVLVIGNTKPDINLRLRRGGEDINLTGCTVTFKLRKLSGNVVSVPLTITSATLGKVSGNFGIGDLDEGGAMRGEIVLVDASGQRQNGREPFDVYVRPEYVPVSA